MGCEGKKCTEQVGVGGWYNSHDGKGVLYLPVVRVVVGENKCLPKEWGWRVLIWAKGETKMPRGKLEITITIAASCESGNE